MIFPTAGYCLSVRYHSPIWFLLVVMSPRTKTNSGKNWVATGHWPTTCNVQNLDELCLHYGTLWCTLQLKNCSICSLWRPVKNVHNVQCTFTNPKTPDIWSSAELDYHRARASSPSALNFPSQQEASNYLLHHNFFYLYYYFHYCYCYLNTYFFLVLHTSFNN